MIARADGSEESQSADPSREGWARIEADNERIQPFTLEVLYCDDETHK